MDVGVGDATINDLFHAQVEVEENGHPVIPIYCFGRISLDHHANEWMGKQHELKGKLVVKEFGVIYDLIDDVRLHLNRVAALGPPKEKDDEDEKELMRREKNRKKSKSKKRK